MTATKHGKVAHNKAMERRNDILIKPDPYIAQGILKKAFNGPTYGRRKPATRLINALLILGRCGKATDINARLLEDILNRYWQRQPLSLAAMGELVVGHLVKYKKHFKKHCGLSTDKFDYERKLELRDVLHLFTGVQPIRKQSAKHLGSR